MGKGKGWKGKKRAKLFTRLERRLNKPGVDTDTIRCAQAIIDEYNVHRDWYRRGDGVFVLEQFLINAGLYERKVKHVRCN